LRALRSGWRNGSQQARGRTQMPSSSNFWWPLARSATDGVVGSSRSRPVPKRRISTQNAEGLRVG
jgi:hypothetical protein